MFETLLQLFDVALELRKAGIGRAERKTLPPKKVTTSKDADSEIAVVHESKPTPKKPTLKPYVAKKPAVPTDISSRIADDRHKAEALKRKKLALTRLRQDQGQQRRPMPSQRRDAASFMNNSMNTGNDQVMFGSMDTSMNSMNNSMNNMNNSMNNSMNGMNQMNNMNMNMDQQMMMNMMMNQNMMEQQFMGGNNMMHNMEMGQNNGGGAFERTLRRSSSGSNIRGRGGPRGRSLRPAPGGAVRKSFASRKGPVKERLGFKSNITVDPSLLNDGTVNEEDY